jgi:glycosyltransferase involved in cell wall biosynthesis
VLLFPDRAAGWIPAAIVAALQATKQQRFDAVLSTSPPVSAHIVAYVIARARGLPWVADYRDLWHGNQYTRKGRARAQLEFGLERILRRRANAITAVHHDLLVQQSRAFGHSFGDVIPAAFDPAEWQNVEDAPPAEFRLCYAGDLYEGRRRLDLVLSAIASLRAQRHPAGAAARVDFYGPDAALVQRLAASIGVSDAVSCHDRVERARILPALRQAAGLLVLLDMSPETAGELGSKLFECLAARRPVIAIGPEGGAVQAFLARHQVGWYATDLAGTEAAVRAAYNAFATGRARRTSNDVFKHISTARDVARRFAALLDTVANANESGALYVE